MTYQTIYHIKDSHTAQIVHRNGYTGEKHITYNQRWDWGVNQSTFMIKPNHLHPTKVCCALGLTAITKGFPSIGSAVLIT